MQTAQPLGAGRVVPRSSAPVRTAVRPAHRTRWSERGRETVGDLDRLLVAVTVGRLALIPLVIALLGVNALATLAVLGVFIAVDVYDGVLGRSRGTDGPARRALDSLVDRVSIHAVLIAAVLYDLLPAWLLVAMLARDLYCAWMCSQMMRERWVAIRADWLYRSLNLALAAWVVLAPLVSATAREIGMAAVLAWAVVVAADLTRSVAKVRAAPPDLHGVVVDAGTLRRARS